MSELKVYHCNEWHNEYTEFYMKSEADKVIAELKRACNSKDDWCLHTLKENRHHKYKQCLAMWLYLRECYWRCQHHNEKTRADWYEKWMDIFKKLAEHYKAAK